MSTPETEAPTPSFADLGLPEFLLEALRAVGYETPSPIQAATIPPLLQGRDLVGQAQTGTGKTAAFALPILARIDLTLAQPQALVLAPTRELAIQVAEAFATYASHLPGFHVLPIYGGQSYVPQLAALRRGTHVIVGTPGRIIDHLERGTLKLDSLRHVVLDEADEMLRMGFIDDVDTILQRTPEQRQVALFSATMPPQIRRIAARHLRDPAEVTIRSRTSTATQVRQRFWMVSGLHKLDALTRILEVEDFDAMIVFARTKVATEELADKLAARGFSTAALNGDVQQVQRERTVQRLKDGQIDILVATDVAARGLDVDRISHVVNYDIPTDTESYVHRIGRTGRAGRSGDAILFITPRERHLLASIERATRQKIEPMQLPSTEAVNDVRIGRFMQRITEAREQEGLEFFQELIERYEREHDVPAVEIAAALARMAQGERPLLLDEQVERAAARESAVRERPARESAPRERTGSERPSRERPTSDRPVRERAVRERPPRDEESAAPRRTLQEVADSALAPRPERATLGLKRPRPAGLETWRVDLGRDHGVEVRHLVGAIANVTGLDNSNIGNIAIRRDYSLVELPAGMPPDAMRALEKVKVLGHPLKMRLAGEDAAPARSGPSRSGPARKGTAAPKRRPG